MFTEMITNSNKRFSAICMNRTTEQRLCDRCLIPRFLFRSYRNFLILYLPTTDIVISLVLETVLCSVMLVCHCQQLTYDFKMKSWVKVQRNKVSGSQFLVPSFWFIFVKLKSVKNKKFSPRLKGQINVRSFGFHFLSI